MNEKTKIFFRFWMPVFLWMTFIFFLSSFQGSEILDLPIPFFHKVVHFFEYSILGILWLRLLGYRRDKRGVFGASVFALILTSGFAMTDEWHQTFVPGRSGSIEDVGWDMICAFMGIFLYALDRFFCIFQKANDMTT
ncbi:MAG TPA: VanZ family protein [Candidatus Omnitrophota bacterium]|nr:VanZ family protein [Candidatus Omnitrophota bacterium]